MTPNEIVEFKKASPTMLTLLLIMSLYLTGFFATFAFNTVSNNINELKEDIEKIKSENQKIRELIINQSHQKQ